LKVRKVGLFHVKQREMSLRLRISEVGRVRRWKEKFFVVGEDDSRTREIKGVTL